MNNDVLLSMKNISKSFAGVQALKDVDFEIRKGSVHCLAGTNGSGKSTLIKIISGVYQADSGTIEIDGEVFEKITPKEAINKGIQVIYQDFSIFPNLTVAENIALPLERLQGTRWINWNRINKNAQKALDLINVDMDLHARLDDLPVANKQLVAICRSLLQNAKILIMDEPTTALTKNEVESLFKVVRELKKQGLAIVFVSHKLDEVYEIAEELTILRNGKKVSEGLISDYDRSEFVYHMTGRKVEQKPFVPEQIGEKPLLDVRNLRVDELLDDITFQLYPGEILGITGLLGSGRSELAKTIFNVISSNGGEVYLDGKLLEPGSVKDMIEAGIGYVPEDRLTEGLFMPQSISKNIYSSTIEKGLSGRFNLIDWDDTKEQSEKWVKELDVVTPSTELAAQSLSGGNQQKVVIAKWLSTKPKILMLNSPTVGVDVGAKYDIYSYIRGLVKEGIGVIIFSDDLPEIINNCNRVLVMRNGRLVENINVSELNESKLEALLLKEDDKEMIKK